MFSKFSKTATLAFCPHTSKRGFKVCMLLVITSVVVFVCLFICLNISKLLIGTKMQDLRNYSVIDWAYKKKKKFLKCLVFEPIGNFDQFEHITEVS